MTERILQGNQRHKRAFIFDMDGTLVDNMKFHSTAWLSLFENLGFHLEEYEFLRTTAGKTNPEILRQIIGKDLSDNEIEQLSNLKESFYRDLYRPQLQPTKGLIPFLEKAKKLGISMAVATAAGKQNIQFILEGLNIKDFFSVVIGAEDIQKGKPDPEIFLKSAQSLQVSPKDCIVFEDSRFGIEAADRAGMQVILLTTSHQPAELGKQSTLLQAATDFSELDPHALL